MRIQYHFDDGLDAVKGKIMIVESEVPNGDRGLQTSIGQISNSCIRNGCILKGFHVEGDICHVNISKNADNKVILG